MKRTSGKFRGVYQRCDDSCPEDRCSRHSWSYQVELPMRDGKRRQVSEGGYASAKAAAEARSELIQKHRDGKVADDGRLTVGQWLDRWIEARENDSDSPLRPTTLLTYRQHTDDYIRPKLGHVRLKDLRREHVSQMLAEIVVDRDQEITEVEARNAKWFERNPGSTTRPWRVPRALSHSSLVRIRASVSSALGDAVDAGLIAANPATGLRLRQGKRRAPDTRPAPKAWSAQDTARFLDATAGDPLAPMWHLAALHGLRRGELCGLKWSSIDLDAGTLAVLDTRTSVGYTVVEGDPKSTYSRATIALDKASGELLRGHRARQAKQRLLLGEAWNGGDLVFVREDGEPWHPDRVSKMFVAAVKRHGLPKISLHGLRHTSASLQLDSGIGIEIVSKRLRHANVTITSGVYSHLVGDAGRQAADAVADAVAKHRKTS